jgi:phage tail-like protein
MPVIELPALYLDGVYDDSGIARVVAWNRDPGPDESGVPDTWHIALDVVDPSGNGVVLADLTIRVNGTLAFDGALHPNAIQAGFDALGSGYAAITDGQRIVLKPTVRWPSETLVSVVIFARRTIDVSAYSVDPYSFTSEDLVEPVLQSVVAVAQKTVRLEYDEPVQVVTATGFTFTATTKPAVPVEPVGATASGSTVDVELDLELTPGAGYDVSVSGVADLAGNSDTQTGSFTGFVPAKPEGRRFDLLDMMPGTEVNNDLSGDLNYWLLCLQDVLDLMLAELDRFLDVISIDRAPSVFLDLILADLGNPFSFELDDDRKRKLASLLVGIYKESGTAKGVENAIRFFVGVEAQVVSYAETALVLGVSELNVDWILGPSGQRELYSFTVETAEELTSTQRAWIYEIAIFMKPAHTHLEFTGEGVVEPAKYPGIVEAVPTGFWILDESELDETTILEE